MLATDHGNGLLNDLATALQDQGESLTIAESEDGKARYRPSTNRATTSQEARNYRDGTFRTPTAALFHELVHGYRDLVGPDPAANTVFANGVETENERAADRRTAVARFIRQPGRAAVLREPVPPGAEPTGAHRVRQRKRRSIPLCSLIGRLRGALRLLVFLLFGPGSRLCMAHHSLRARSVNSTGMQILDHPMQGAVKSGCVPGLCPARRLKHSR